MIRRWLLAAAVAIAADLAATRVIRWWERTLGEIAEALEWDLQSLSSPGRAPIPRDAKPGLPHACCADVEAEHQGLRRSAVVGQDRDDAGS